MAIDLAPHFQGGDDTLMKELADLFGFADAFTLPNFFKRSVGISPKEYRRRGTFIEKLPSSKEALEPRVGIFLSTFDRLYFLPSGIAPHRFTSGAVGTRLRFFLCSS